MICIIGPGICEVPATTAGTLIGVSPSLRAAKPPDGSGSHVSQVLLTLLQRGAAAVDVEGCDDNLSCSMRRTHQRHIAGAMVKLGPTSDILYQRLS